MIKFDYLYKPNELPTIALSFLSNPFSQSVIPTEVVVEEIGQVFLPLVKRTYNTGLYYLRNNIVDYSVLRNEPDFKGTSHYQSIVMEEVWEDYGSDGHIEYRMMGFIFKVL